VIDVSKMAGITNLNITSPFKQDAALACLSHLRDSIVEKLMAANTVVIKDAEASAEDNMLVFNTDYLGVYESVKNILQSKKDKTAFVVGAGGAGIAAAYGLSLAGFNVTVFNRTASKAFEKTRRIKNCSAASLEDINKQICNADIIVNALPVDDVFFDVNKIRKDTMIFDANYKNSALMRSAAENGLQTISGLKWLVNQAISSFEIFTGLKLPADCIDLFTEENLVYDKKNNIALIGFMGSGKTTIGKIVASLFDTDFIDIDKEIEKKEKMTIVDIFKYKNENYFRQIEKRITETIFNSEKGKVIACGGGAITDSENRKIIASESFPVWLIAPPEVSVKRITDNSRPLLNREKKYEEAVKLFNERIDFYGITSSLIIDSSKRSAQDIAKKLYEEISLVFKR
jgi:shikimate kinase/shikimate 5-dehydrogenase